MHRRSFALSLAALALPGGTLSEGDALLLETTQLLGAVSGASDKFSLVQQYLAQRQKVTTYLEASYSGMTVDWGKIPAVLIGK